MREDDAAQLRKLVPALLDLLGRVASGECEAADASAEYGYLHGEVRRILTLSGEPCICPWPTIWGWSGTALKDPDWQGTIAKRASKARILCGLEEPPPWSFEDYWRGGDANDTPFWSEFVAGLEQDKQAILLGSLNRELAFLGTRILDDRTKGHTYGCNRKPGFSSSVILFKIRHGSGSGEVALRVFFITASGYRLVLLHGYDKGADPDPDREDREADAACRRREDVMRQRAAGVGPG